LFQLYAAARTDINLMGHVYTCKEILPLMIENGYGKVVNIASDAARVGSYNEGLAGALTMV